jgi:ZIP family zinc transporter
MAIDFLVPHEYIEERMTGSVKNKKLMTAGVLTAIGIAIHNFPEGLAVFMSALGDTSLGISLAFAIALHNIPEGLAVAMPIYYATKSKAKAVWYSFLSGIAEPIGAIVGVIILFPYINDTVLSISLAFVAGIMIFISFDELLPLCFHNKKNHTPIVGLFIGMAVMAISLHLL